jgi:ubiquinol-cytochrome c reductase cytochrome c1 subunit
MLYAADTSIVRGAAVFDRYCRGCHALQYAQPAYKTNLPDEDALRWFGRVPPDLSLIMTVRGQTWLHDYLTGFYLDEKQIYGENNAVLPHVNMPNPFSLLSSAEKEKLIEDLLCFLSNVAEPDLKSHRQVGYWILLWLFCLNIILYYLYLLIQKKINTKK